MVSPHELVGGVRGRGSQVLPDATRSAQEEMSGNLKLAISGILNKLDLVSRDEFDAQQAVLIRTREKLEQLEKDFAELEKRIASN